MRESQLTLSQLEYLKDNLLPSIMAVALGLVAIVSVFYGAVPSIWLFSWAACALLVLLFRSWVYLHLKKTLSDGLNTDQAIQLITLSATATGITWGTASIIFAIHTDDVMLWIFLAFFMSGYASGAVFSTSALLSACAGYFFPTIVPITIWFFLQDTPHAHWMGLLLAVFTLAAWKMAMNANHYLIEKVEKQMALQEARQKLELSQSKTDALQTMAGGIAHDFNNLFAGINNTLYLLGRESLSDRGKKLLTMAQESIDNGADLSTKMLNYSRSSLREDKPIEVNALIRNRIEHISDLFASVAFEFNGSDSEAIVNADRKQFSRVVDAILCNACESYPDESGKVVISVKRLASGNAKRDKHHQDIDIKVADSGCGMSEEVQEKLFDPFFSTKFTGRGLGMSVVYGIIKRMNGDISVKSELSKGTTISLRLPATKAG